MLLLQLKVDMLKKKVILLRKSQIKFFFAARSFVISKQILFFYNGLRIIDCFVDIVRTEATGWTRHPINTAKRSVETHAIEKLTLKNVVNYSKNKMLLYKYLLLKIF